ncbi:Crp/Fnr family transcriptional regulator [Avibacterium paragallinarum]|uniref:Crp/Fnr family transcriptional regulator n=1 Tax=Avibacterium paragallinarum TaxID=728 RepID=A0A0F5EZ78_AVIPA|nr:Crp/Fnr family transcriptional regulator [Avibacterium paragallinarum]KAA6208226.1 Crp/Fnr family transcriptional regulator [Avibacterium paragallinarum]KKB01665.1 cyclic nucleotide-binding protein [Avibacterium paragallinarum]RZN56575.1 Crp/Fnr family transcriptional regulator [Avibacterium paragallinarum]RZN72705.1 Crp/Fnr family transcriptional regulator [Avibacterium paragallinarum]SUU96830.1 Nitrogen-responsive regulatory protein [Avibacterium paragallinarum]
MDIYRDFNQCQLSNSYKVEKGIPIYHQGDTAQSFYFIQQGLIGLYHTLENGKESLVRIYKSGDYFGFRTLFGDKKYHCTAKVLMEAEIIKITPLNIDHFFLENPATIRLLFQLLSNELREAEGRLAKSAYLKSLDRVIDSIYFLKENFPEYHWTHREIGEYAGCETETAIRISRDLRKKNLF